MVKKNRGGEFMKKSREYIKSNNFKELCKVSPRNGKGVKLPKNLRRFNQGLEIYVGHIRQAKKKR
ncbi:MAG: hypothetical protein AAB736_01685 [Patescibacteria group bacterium]